MKKSLLAVFGLLLIAGTLDAQTPKPVIPIYSVEGLVAQDMPYDDGGVSLLTWKSMPYDGPDVKYRIMASLSSDGPWKEAATIGSQTKYTADIKLPFWAWEGNRDWHAYKIELIKVFPLPQSEKLSSEGLSDRQKFLNDKAEERKRKAHSLFLRSNPIYFKVVAVGLNREADSQIVSSVASANWFNLPRLNNMVCAVVLIILFLWFISHAKKKELFLRRIPGLDAVDEALGRATEMGRPIFFLTGRLSISSMSTLAATFILGEIAKKVAQYDTRIKVPHMDPLTMTVCQEIVKQSYTEAGRPDSYREDINFFVTDEQFAFTAAVDGMISREKPAACFYMGYYYAESLLLTEVGSSVGAIQIAGTDSESQLPFFFTTCDYTLMGEELYAAGAYLSKDPVLVGTLRAQDVGKAFVMAAIIIGVVATTLGTIFGFDLFVKIVKDPFVSF